MNYCILGIGSNVRADYHCDLMLKAINETFNVLQVSDLYPTKAQGEPAADYLNGAVLFCTETDRWQLKDWCRSVEDQLGRIRGHSSCCADLDILYCAPAKPYLRLLEPCEAFYKIALTQLLM